MESVFIVNVFLWMYMKKKKGMRRIFGSVLSAEIIGFRIHLVVVINGVRNVKLFIQKSKNEEKE